MRGSDLLIGSKELAQRFQILTKHSTAEVLFASLVFGLAHEALA